MLGDEEYRRRRDSARCVRYGDLDNLRRVLASGGADSPGKRTRTDRVHEEFDVTKHDLTYMYLRGASSVGTAATVAFAQGPNEGPKKFVYVHVKEDPTELAPRRGLA